MTPIKAASAAKPPPSPASPAKRRRAKQSRRCAGSPPPDYRHSRATECARLIPVATRRRLVAKPRTPHLIPQAAQLFKLPARNVGGRGERPSSFSGGYKGGILFEKRIPPLPGSSAKSCTIYAAPLALQPPTPAREIKRENLFEKRIPPLPGSGAQRRTIHAAPAALQPPSPREGDQRGKPLREENTPFAWQWRSAPHYPCSASGAATTYPPRGRSKGKTSSRREYPLCLAAAQRAALFMQRRWRCNPHPPAREIKGDTLFGKRRNPCNIKVSQ